ncbi:hypothetical protein BTVI_22527 [Pitangus sulphuratus]|nr:hypothetical protein BTVI_22527 [Pitangus sulphuratus]
MDTLKITQKKSNPFAQSDSNPPVPPTDSDRHRNPLQTGCRNRDLGKPLGPREERIQEEESAFLEAALSSRSWQQERNSKPSDSVPSFRRCAGSGERARGMDCVVVMEGRLVDSRCEMGEGVWDGPYHITAVELWPHGDCPTAWALPSCPCREQETEPSPPLLQPSCPKRVVGGKSSLPFSWPFCPNGVAGKETSLLVAGPFSHAPLLEEAYAECVSLVGGEIMEGVGEKSVVAPPNEDRGLSAGVSVRKWERCQEEALCVGDWEVINACPVIYHPHQDLPFQSLPYEVTEELRQIVKERGVSLPRVFSYLETLSSTYVFMPHDWNLLLKMVLTMIQYNVWLMDFRESCAAYAKDQSGLQAGMTCAHLVGKGAYTVLGSQVDYLWEIYEVIAKLVLRVVRRLPSMDKDSNLSFAKVLQGSTKPFT